MEKVIFSPDKIISHNDKSEEIKQNLTVADTQMDVTDEEVTEVMTSSPSFKAETQKISTANKEKSMIVVNYVSLVEMKNNHDSVTAGSLSTVNTKVIEKVTTLKSSTDNNVLIPTIQHTKFDKPGDKDDAKRANPEK